MAIVLSGTTGIDAGSLPVNNCGNTEVEGNLNLSGVGARITGDFSNATVTNRVMFQTSTVNGNTIVGVIPNGTGANGQFRAINSSNDPANSSWIAIQAATTESQVLADKSGTGSYLPMSFYTGGSERMRIDTAWNVGIGTSSPTAKFQVAGGFSAVTLGSFPSLIASGSYGGGIGLFDSVSYVGMYATGSGQVLNFFTNANNSNTVASSTKMTLDAGGSLLLTSGTGGLGYGTGAGGTVTQLTSKSTAVTLNKPSGVIIMNNSALAAGSLVYFKVFNSLFSANDTVIVNFKGGWIDYSSYRLGATSDGAAGYFYITVENRTASSKSEAVQIKYEIIKGATA